MMYTLNLAQLPAVSAQTLEFLVWIVTNQIGNWDSLAQFIASDETWYQREIIPFECTEKEALWIMLRWA